MNVLDLIFPKTCLECGKYGKYICEGCIKKVPACRQAWPSGGPNSIWKYQGVVRKAIIALKYKFATEIADELIGYIDLPPSNQTLVPIPIHKYRQNLRGFNQTELLGEKLAAKMDWGFMPDLLVKKTPTKPQVGLKGIARHQNISGVFSVNPNYSLSTNRYSLVLFDDVFTTGSTLNEATKVLKIGGAKNVWGLTIAR